MIKLIVHHSDTSTHRWFTFSDDYRDSRVSNEFDPRFLDCVERLDSRGVLNDFDQKIRANNDLKDF